MRTLILSLFLSVAWTASAALAGVPLKAMTFNLRLATGNDGQYRKLCAILGLDAMAEQPDYLTNADRVRNRDSSCR